MDAFFDNDLIASTRMFLKSARGSFGLCVTSSLDAHRQVGRCRLTASNPALKAHKVSALETSISSTGFKFAFKFNLRLFSQAVLAARGQTMSVAFYPKLGRPVQLNPGSTLTALEAVYDELL